MREASDRLERHPISVIKSPPKVGVEIATPPSLLAWVKVLKTEGNKGVKIAMGRKLKYFLIEGMKRRYRVC